MASIMDLLKSNKKDIYGNNGLIYIESRGIINPSRLVALAASSPNAAADMIGNAVAGVAGGSAKRPSDTIYKGREFFNKPISLEAPTAPLLRDSVKPNQPYFVKTEPNPGAGLYKDIKTIVGGNKESLQSLGIKALNKYGSPSGIQNLKNLRNQLKNPTGSDTYGPKWSYGGNNARKPKEEDIKYSTHYKGADGKLAKRENTKSSTISTPYGDVLKNSSAADIINYEILKSLGQGKNEFTDKDLTDFKAKNNKVNVPYVLFQLYKKENSNILLPGTVTGISEDYAPEISNFKFIGSPFNLYRYTGMERTLKFELKMYFVDQDTKHSMSKNLDKLRKLVFPDENITAIKYPGLEEKYTPLTFNPNLVYLTIHGLYYKLLGIVDSLSITIEDNTSWATTDNSSFDGSEIKALPSIFNVSISMKIIEHPNVSKSGDSFAYEYGESKEGEYKNYFTGYNEYGDNYEKPEMKTLQNPASSTIPTGPVASTQGPVLSGVQSSSPAGMWGG